MILYIVLFTVLSIIFGIWEIIFILGIIKAKRLLHTPTKYSIRVYERDYVTLLSQEQRGIYMVGVDTPSLEIYNLFEGLKVNPFSDESNLFKSCKL
jgi:hypothetical protein